MERLKAVMGICRGVAGRGVLDQGGVVRVCLVEELQVDLLGLAEAGVQDGEVGLRLREGGLELGAWRRP